MKIFPSFMNPHITRVHAQKIILPSSSPNKDGRTPVAAEGPAFDCVDKVFLVLELWEKKKHQPGT